MSSQTDNLPAAGFVRLRHIIGDKKSVPPITPIIPVGKTAWFAGIKRGIYPAPVRVSSRTSLYRVEDIRAFLQRT